MEQLLLSQQICFPVYAASRLINKAYQPFLDELGLTYPQYLTLLVLWETDAIPVSEITTRLMLDTNTVTPLLKRMEVAGWLTRERSSKDERKVIVKLTAKGEELKSRAATIPERLAGCLISDELSGEALLTLRDQLNTLICSLSKFA